MAPPAGQPQQQPHDDSAGAKRRRKAASFSYNIRCDELHGASSSALVARAAYGPVGGSILGRPGRIKVNPQDRRRRNGTMAQPSSPTRDNLERSLAEALARTLRHEIG